MKLDEFPSAIAQAMRHNLQIEQQLRAAQTAYNRLIAGYEAEIAFDKRLTNEAQRKARKAELFNQPEYQAMIESLEALKDQQESARIEMRFLENEFTVARLMRQGEIALLDRQ